MNTIKFIFKNCLLIINHFFLSLEYLLGLKCFEKPTAKASTCTSDMAKGITSISAKQMKNGLSMEGFFNDFCE